MYKLQNDGGNNYCVMVKGGVYNLFAFVLYNFILAPTQFNVSKTLTKEMHVLIPKKNYTCCNVWFYCHYLDIKACANCLLLR